MATDYEIYRPPGHPVPESARLSPARTWGAVLLAGPFDCFIVASAICVAVWLLTGGGYFWPMWVMLGTGVPALLGVLGSARDAAPRRPWRRASQR